MNSKPFVSVVTIIGIIVIIAGFIMYFNATNRIDNTPLACVLFGALLCVIGKLNSIHITLQKIQNQTDFQNEEPNEEPDEE